MEIRRRAVGLEQSKDSLGEEVQFGKGLAGCRGLEEEGCSGEKGMCENHRRIEAGLSKPVKMETHALVLVFSHTALPSSLKSKQSVTFTTSGVRMLHTHQWWEPWSLSSE